MTQAHQAAGIIMSKWNIVNSYPTFCWKFLPSAPLPFPWDSGGAYLLVSVPFTLIHHSSLLYFFVVCWSPFWQPLWPHWGHSQHNVTMYYRIPLTVRGVLGRVRVVIVAHSRRQVWDSIVPGNLLGTPLPLRISPWLCLSLRSGFLCVTWCLSLLASFSPLSLTLFPELP